MTTEEKLLNFQNSTMEAARLKSTEIIQKFETSLQKEYEEHKERKERQVKLLIKAEQENLLREKNKQISMAQIHIRKELTDTHAQLKEQLFEEVREMLLQYMTTSNYDKLLINQIKKDIKFARGQEITIYIDPIDIDRKESLEAATGVSLTVSEYSFIGGTRSVLSKQHILIDDSFQTKLNEAYEDFSFKGGLTHE